MPLHKELSQHRSHSTSTELELYISAPSRSRTLLDSAERPIPGYNNTWGAQEKQVLRGCSHCQLLSREDLVTLAPEAG